MSAVPAKAGIARSPRHVCFVPEADIVCLTGARGYARFFCRQVVVVGAAICRKLIVVGDRHGIPPRDRAALCRRMKTRQSIPGHCCGVASPTAIIAVTLIPLCCRKRW